MLSDLDDSKKRCEFKMKLVRARKREKIRGKALPRATHEKSPALRVFLSESQPTLDTHYLSVRALKLLEAV